MVADSEVVRRGATLEYLARAVNDAIEPFGLCLDDLRMPSTDNYAKHIDIVAIRTSLMAALWDAGFDREVIESLFRRKVNAVPSNSALRRTLPYMAVFARLGRALPEVPRPQDMDFLLPSQAAMRLQITKVDLRYRASKGTIPGVRAEVDGATRLVFDPDLIDAIAEQRDAEFVFWAADR